MKNLTSFAKLLEAQQKIWEAANTPESSPTDDNPDALSKKSKFRSKPPEDPEEREKEVKEAKRLVSKAKYYIQKTTPVVGLTLQTMKFVITYDVPTMAVDDKANCYINPAFAKSITTMEGIGVLVHEVLHILTETHTRRRSRSHKLWSICTDYLMNYLIINDGIDQDQGTKGVTGNYELPEGGCIPTRSGDVTFRMPDGSTRTWNVKGKTAEWLYTQLEKAWEEIKEDIQEVDWKPQQGEIITDPRNGHFGRILNINGGSIEVERLTKEQAIKILKQQQADQLVMYSEAAPRNIRKEVWHIDNVRPVQLTGGGGQQPPGPSVKQNPPPIPLEDPDAEDEPDDGPVFPNLDDGDSEGEPGQEPQEEPGEDDGGEFGGTTAEERRKAREILRGPQSGDPQGGGEPGDKPDEDPQGGPGAGEPEEGDGTEEGDPQPGGRPGDPGDEQDGDPQPGGRPSGRPQIKPGQEPTNVSKPVPQSGPDKELEEGVTPLDEEGNATSSLDEHHVDSSKIRIEAGSPEPNAKAPTQQQIKNVIKQAAQTVQSQNLERKQRQRERQAGAGTGFEGITGMVLEHAKSRLDYREILSKIMKVTKKKYDQRRPSRRSFAVGSMLPRIKKVRELQNICIAIDTSGSMGQKELNQIVAEIAKLVKQFPNISLRLIFWTDRVYFAKEYTKTTAEEMTATIAKYTGSGGTNMSSVANYFMVNKLPTPVATIYFTDGDLWEQKVNLIPGTTNFYLIIPGGKDDLVSQLPGQTINIRIPD